MKLKANKKLQTEFEISSNSCTVSQELSIDNFIDQIREIEKIEFPK